MDPRSVIANRIDLGLRRHVGEGVDPQRTLHDARYARDVLLVCDALKGTDLPQLARQFRAAGAPGAVASGFDTTMPARLFAPQRAAASNRSSSAPSAT
jgi:hypothetical protein